MTDMYCKGFLPYYNSGHSNSVKALKDLFSWKYIRGPGSLINIAGKN